jgi:aspartate aminotransferase
MALRQFIVRAAPARAFSTSSWWKNVEMGPKDPILGVSEAFNACTNPAKLNLGVGAYRDDAGKPVVLPSVKIASQRIVEQNMNNEYGPIGGTPQFAVNCLKLALGAESPVLKNKNYATLQALSGTGSLRLAGQFIAKFAAGGKKPDVYVPNPTWSNHFNIFQDCGLAVKTYRYYDPKTIGLDLAGMLADIKAAPKGSVFLLHAAAHNPTGVDPTQAQWVEIELACKAAGQFVLFDSAYQGFASGDPVKDAFSVRHFVAQGHQIAIAQSFAKNFGLYGQRVGAVTFLGSDKDEAAKMESQLKILARSTYSNPPVHGARIVDIILSDAALNKQWHGEVKEMAERIIKMRTLLFNNLKAAGSTKNWNHVNDQIGMFCYSGMTPEQVDRLTNEFHIYMTRNGRISMAGVTSKNVQYLAQSMHAVTK